ncbi:MAG: NAD(P)(+) transhydrogenase (Re/Si-specific) subunit beta [Thermaerobacter sp.]|nr:NAD(P)(+) transhydrogenase (Re/Si-specific) subunit beta [Thermaerobacter sp.]
MTSLREAAYMVAAILFIVGVMRLRNPATARSGNLIAAAGMVIAVAFTMIGASISNVLLLIAMVVVGAVIGTYSARAVKMTAMPQMVAVFNGMGGGAAALIALSEALHAISHGSYPGLAEAVPGLFDMLVGSISFAGSLIAFMKLQEWITGRATAFKGQNIVNAVILILLVVLAVSVPIAPQGDRLLLDWILIVGSLILGVSFVMPVGGADMPVIIALLNAFTGIAAAAAGFVLQNDVLIVAGALVGSSGTILTLIMSRAMNRSIFNVLFSAFGSKVTAKGASERGEVHPTNAEEVGMLCAYAQRVVIVPGYGLAVARAQQECKDLMDALVARGVDVRFAIHPVAGRMPGHMNVLLAEANVPYDRLYDMDDINPEFQRTDVVLIIGANDVVNPDARENPGSPIYGMPILNVDQAKMVIVNKRSMAAGFAGIDNPLFFMPNTMMYFGDAKGALQALLQALKEAA